MGIDLFEGWIKSASPLKGLYEPGELLILHLESEVTFTSNYMVTTGRWETRWEVFNEAGNIIGKDSRLHSIAPWTAVDDAEDDFELNCGKVPGYSQNIRVRLQARVSGMIPTKPFTFVDDVYIPINVVRSPVEPSPVPAPSPIPGYPSPAPKPTPIPPPITEPEVPYDEEPYGVPTGPGVAPAPKGALIPGVSNKSLAIGLIAIGAILALTPGKPAKKGK